jgi:hypothetical protein
LLLAGFQFDLRRGEFSLKENQFYQEKYKLLKIIGIERTIRKIYNPVAALC